MLVYFSSLWTGSKKSPFIKWSKKCPSKICPVKNMSRRKYVPSKVSVNNMSVKNMSVKNMSIENMSVENMSVEKMSRCPSKMRCTRIKFSLQVCWSTSPFRLIRSALRSFVCAVFFNRVLWSAQVSSISELDWEEIQSFLRRSKLCIWAARQKANKIR